MHSANDHKQMKRFGVVFVIDSIIRCLTIVGFSGGKYGFMAMLAVWPVALAMLIGIFSFYIYSLSQMMRTVEILYKNKIFYLSPGWSVLVQFIFGHGIFGFILPTIILIQTQQYQQLLNVSIVDNQARSGGEEG